MSNTFEHMSYLVRKKILKLFGEEFHIFDPDGNVVMFAKMKAFKIKEDITLFTGEDMMTPVMIIKARNIIDFSATYDVFDSTNNQKVGALKRKGLKSILKDEWAILDNEDNQIGRIEEDSIFMAILRRIMASIIPQEYNVVIGENIVSNFKQNFNPFVTKITVDFAKDINGSLDKRLGIAAAILLCQVEGRQD